VTLNTRQHGGDADDIAQATGSPCGRRLGSGASTVKAGAVRMTEITVSEDLYRAPGAEEREASAGGSAGGPAPVRQTCPL
jgi:hypothetical protein